jgi:Homeodomain-like domain
MREKGSGRDDARLRREVTGMGRQENGYITITAGMPDSHDGGSVHVDRLLNRDQRRTLATRLRAQGWSYRRISAEMALPYATVLQWLDGEERPAGPARGGIDSAPVMRARAIPASAPAPAAPVPPAGPSAAAEMADMARRIDRLTAAHQAQQAALAEMETRLVAAMEAQHRTLADRLLEGVKAMISKILPV